MTIKKNLKGGFLRLKPDVFGYEKNDKEKYKCDWEKRKVKNPNIYEWWKLVQDNEPYKFFITLTFRGGTSINKMIQYINHLLDRYNQKIYRRSYKRKCKFVEGFIFQEDYKSVNCGKNRKHVHMLIKCTDQYNFKEHKDIFIKAASKIIDGKKRHVFTEKNIDFQKYRDDGAINYCMKELDDKNVDDRLRTIGMEGVF